MSALVARGASRRFSQGVQGYFTALSEHPGSVDRHHGRPIIDMLLSYCKYFCVGKNPEQVKQNSTIIQQKTGLIRQVLLNNFGIMEGKGFIILTF